MAFGDTAVWLHLQQVRIISIKSNILEALERRFGLPNGAKLNLEWRFGRPNGAKLALEQRFGRPGKPTLPLERHFAGPGTAFWAPRQLVQFDHSEAPGGNFV